MPHPVFGTPQAAQDAGTPSFPHVFDINLNNEGATRRLQYLVDGTFLDNHTRGISVSIISYNGTPHSWNPVTYGAPVAYRCSW